MARTIAIGQYEPEVTAEEGMRRIIPEMSGASVGPELEQLGDTVGQISQRLQQQDAAAYVSSSIAQLRVGGEQNLLNAPQADVDKAGGLTPYVMQGYRQSVAGAIKAAPNPLAARMLQQQANEFGSDLEMRTMERDAQQRVASRAAGAESAIDQATTAVSLNPDSWQPTAAEQLSAIRALGLDPDDTLRLSHQANQQIGEAAGRGYAQRDPQGTLTRLQDPKDPLFSGLPQQSRDTIETYAQGQLVSQHAQGIVDTYRVGGPDAGAAAFAALDKSGLPDALKDRVLTEAHQGLEQFHTEAAQEHAQTITALDTGIASGNLPANARSTAQSLYQAGAFDQQQYAGALEGIAKAEKKAQDDAQTLNYALDAYSRRTPLDPRSSDDRGAADLLLTRASRGQPVGSPSYANAAVDITTRVGVVPDAAVSWARSSLTGGDAQSAAQAADLLARLSDTNSRAYGFAVDDKTASMALQISQAVKAGTDPALAVNLARSNANADPAQKKAIAERWKQTKAPQSQPGGLTSLLKDDPAFKPGWFSSLPDVPPLMQGQFDTLTRQYFDSTGGNLQQARQLAFADIKHTWGASEVNGKRELMQYAPEAMFPGLTAQVIRDDIASSLKGVNASQVHLIATDHTARTGGQEWQLGAPDQFGALDVMRGKDGNPLVYRLPVGQADYAATRAREGQAAIAKARVTQQQRAQIRQFAGAVSAERALANKE